MKSQVKKIISLLVCACVLLSAMVFTAFAADTTVKITFDDLAKRTSISTSQQVWEENGITVTNEKGTSTYDINESYYNPIRCYKSSTVTIEYPGMKTIVIDSLYDYSKDYAAPWAESFDPSLGTAVVNDDYDVTITLNNAVDSLTFATMSGQGRAYSITVYTDGSTPPVENGDKEDKDDKDDTPATAPEIVDTVVANTAYRFGMVQENVSATDVYYLTGAMNGYYMDTTTDATAAIDVYLEETDGGYYLYTMVDGVKTYINMVVSGTYVNGAYETAASTVYTYDADAKTVVATVNDELYWFATRNDNTYTTLGPAKVSYAGFYGQFYTVSADDVGEVTPPAGDDTPATAPEIVDTVVADTAYRFGMVQENVSATNVYYLTGAMSGYYMDTTTDVTAAIDVYLEETDGGYYLYTMVDGVKTYINMVVSGTYVNGAYETVASTVYTYDADAKTVVATVNDELYWFATRNDNTYTTLGPAKVSYAGFYGQFYTVSVTDGGNDNVGDDNTGDDEDKTAELPTPDATNTLSIKDAIELGASQETSTYTEEMYYVTGQITGYYNNGTTYGNVYIADEDGNEIIVYGMYDVGGDTRYDALESKPDVGDTVTVYGVVGNYNGTPQLKNAWIVEFTEGELDVETPAEPEADSVLTIEEAIELGLTKRSNEFTTNKYYVTGEITEIYNETYGNMKITDAEGNILTLYGTWEVLDEIRFDAMEVKPEVGDTITVYGIIGQYNGTPQMKNGVFTTVPATDDDDTTTDNGTTVGGNNTTGGTQTDGAQDGTTDTNSDSNTNGNTDGKPVSPTTGDAVGSCVAMAIAAAAVILYTSKKR